MMYIFDIYKQIGTEPSNNDLWLGRKITTYHDIAAEVEQMNIHNDCYIYFIRVA